MMFLVTATVTRKRTDEHGTEWECTEQVPTFLLDGNIQGIVSGDGEGAGRVALRLLSIVAGETGAAFHVTVTPAQILPDLVSGNAPVNG